jgi:HK97 family phage major capsid protein
MADDSDNGNDVSQDKLVAYKLCSDFGENKAGCVVHLPEKAGDALCKAGMAEIAESLEGDAPAEDDMKDDMGDAPVVANAIKEFGKTLEQTQALALSKLKPVKTEASVPATPKKGPAYKSRGAMCADILRWENREKFRSKGIHVDNNIINRIAQAQEELADQWTKKLGYQVKAPLGINETTQSQGGYLVNPEFSSDVYTIPHTQLDLEGECQHIDAHSNILNRRIVNESSLANGSIFGGLNIVATAEGASFTSSLPAWANMTYQLQKIGLFYYVTMEELEDASYPLESELEEYSGKAFLYGINTQIVQGSTLEGLLNTPALVTITSSGNDTSWTSNPVTSLTYADLSKMWAQVYPDAQTSAKGYWLFHPSLVLPLTQMTYTFSGSNPAWGIQYDAQVGLEGRGPGIPPGTPYKIFGKPAYPSFAMSAPGSVGDIMYCDFGDVLAYKRPFRMESSVDFQFGTDQVAARFVWRGDIKTQFRNKITGPMGAQQFSSIVTRSSVGT